MQRIKRRGKGRVGKNGRGNKLKGSCRKVGMGMTGGGWSWGRRREGAFTPIKE